MTSPGSLQSNRYSGYRVFLLRLWQDAPKQPWHVLLQDDLGERKLFADADALADFLRGQMSNMDHETDNLNGE